MTMKHRFTLLLAIALLGAVSCSTGDVATPDEAARVEEFKAHEAALEAQRAQAETPADVAAIESAIEETQAQRAALETSIAERAVGGIIDTIDAFIPIPLQPWKTQLSMLGALLAFRRPRQHLGRGVRSLTRLHST